MGSQHVKRSGIELWGGVECTVNRIGNRFMDQWHRSGHAERPADFDQIASLGIRKLRQSVLWERVAPESLDHCDWTWPDEALGALSDLQIEPIVGLLHHGSGPAYTNLLDPEFPRKLAQYAREVAERYPHVGMYTPVNEPLTTARFSALYGLWYPHTRDSLSFARALLNEVKGTVLAMREIRKVNPDAQLVQTEDLGKTYSTQELQEQAEFENDRRWATWDLLCGEFDQRNLLYRVFRKVGVSEAELAWFQENPCPPDILGVNTYVTSERFLDHRLGRYPKQTHGGNGRQAYADVEAVRVLAGGIDGPAGLVAEAWQRYHLPIAITECHLNCTREEQVRWLVSVWEGAHDLREAGVAVEAVTAWSLFGAYDWNSLLCQDEGCYEPGAFDLRGPTPRETALAGAIRRLATGRYPDVPWLDGPGWWERPIRLEYPPVVLSPREDAPALVQPDRRQKNLTDPVLILGSGPAAKAFVNACEVRGLCYRNVAWPDVDCASVASIDTILNESDPWAVVNATGFEHAEAADQDPTTCFRENMLATMLIAQACAIRHIRLLTLSTDQVFDGKQKEPYVEEDMPWPQGNYGRSKWEAEYRVAEAGADALIVRLGLAFGPGDQQDFLGQLLQASQSRNLFPVAHDQLVTPTYLPHMADAALDLLQDGENGIWHLAHPDPVSLARFAELAACAAGIDATLIRPVKISSKGSGPKNRALTSERGLLLPPLEEALADWANQSVVEPSSGGSIFLM